MKQLKFIILIMIAVFMASCIKDENQSSGVGDALIVTKKIDGNTVYGISLYAYTFSSFQSVKVVSEAHIDKTYTLKSYNGSKTNFYYETPDADFTATKPEASTYDFSAIFENGVSNGFLDQLSALTLPLPNIEKCEYNLTKLQIEVNWTLLTEADNYAITILDGSTIVFGSTQLAKTIKAYAISASGGGWAAGFTPQNGKTYTVRLLAFMLEPAGDSYNVQATSISDSTVVWGTN